MLRVMEQCVTGRTRMKAGNVSRAMDPSSSTLLDQSGDLRDAAAGDFAEDRGRWADLGEGEKRNTEEREQALLRSWGEKERSRGHLQPWRECRDCGWNPSISCSTQPPAAAGGSSPELT